MNIKAVTTFNKSGLDKYGKRMMSSFVQHWSMGIPLCVYHEGWDPEVDFLEPVGIEDGFHTLEFKELNWHSTWLKDFKQRHRARPTENYRFDAVRFSHKVAALLHASLDTSIDYLIWLDGDVITHSDFDAEHLDTLLPKEECIAWLDRARFYPECGFYIINMRHPETEALLCFFTDMYTRDKLFDLKEWHDSYVLQQCVIQLNVPAKSLSGPQGFPTHHPLVNGPLGQWFDHLKGARKARGKSMKIDVLVKRDEPYWRGL